MKVQMLTLVPVCSLLTDEGQRYDNIHGFWDEDDDNSVITCRSTETSHKPAAL